MKNITLKQGLAGLVARGAIVLGTIGLSGCGVYFDGTSPSDLDNPTYDRSSKEVPLNPMIMDMLEYSRNH